jgi:small nuclear ribonucleoprotein E
MNLVIDEAVEIKLATKTTEETRKSLGIWDSSSCFGTFLIKKTGQIMLKGDNVSLIQSA